MKIIKLDKFKPRPYQIPFIAAFENKSYKNLLVIWPRRSGKDLVAWNLMIRQAVRQRGNYFYCLPERQHAKKVIWNSMTFEGDRFLDYIPAELIFSTNSQELTITLINGSIITFIGSDRYDKNLIGTNPLTIIMSEYAVCDPRSYYVISPILNANPQARLIVLSTPRGKNALWDLYSSAIHHPDNWFVQKLTLDDTKHIPLEMLEQNIKEGLISPEFIQQEYYTSFDSMGVEGAVYNKALDRMFANEQIGTVPWQTDHKVHTAWDIGRDTTSIVFFQVINNNVHVINYLEKAGEQLDYFAKLVQEKSYVYGRHFFPHDMKNIEWAGPKITRVEKARQLGIKATLVDKILIEDGIEHVRSTMSRMWIDKVNCKKLIACLENYRFEYSQKSQTYSREPVHNWASHGSDAVRYMCTALMTIDTGMTKEDIKKLKSEALGSESMPFPFNAPKTYMR